jgi:hypothetical protein
MLRIYTGAALLFAVAIGVEDAFRGSTPNYTNCGSHSVICASGGTAYHWASALSVALVALVALLVVGYPIMIGGRIGKQRNRRGYLAGIFFSWAGLIYIVVRKPRTGPDLISRAVSDYRGSGVAVPSSGTKSASPAPPSEPK